MFAGMEWLGSTPARLASLVLVASGFWLVYWRRRLAPARVLMALTVCATVFFMVLPMALMPWNSDVCAPAGLGPGAGRGHGAHFTAQSARLLSRRSPQPMLATDAEFVAATRGNGDTLWDERGAARCRAEFHRLCHQHRTARTAARLAREAQLRAGGLLRGRRDALLAAPRQIHHGQHGGGSLAHAWMLPEGAVQKLRGAQPQLELTYSLSLLKPREYRVPTDGKRHALPGLGYCSAVVDEPGNRIDVDCFSAFTHSAQISAELNEHSASRVYSLRGFCAGFRALAVRQAREARRRLATARAARHHYGHRVGCGELFREVPDIARHPRRRPRDLPFAGDRRQHRFQKASWRDAAPHEMLLHQRG